MNHGSTDGCAEDLEFYIIWIDLDCLTLSLKMTRRQVETSEDRFGKYVNNVKYITD